MRPFLGPRIECGVTSLHRSSRHRYHIRTSLIVSRKRLNTAEAVDIGTTSRIRRRTEQMKSQYRRSSRHRYPSGTHFENTRFSLNTAEAVDIGTKTTNNNGNSQLSQYRRSSRHRYLYGTKYCCGVDVSIPPKQ